MFKLFIDRPVLSTVISIIILIVGVLAYTSLPVTQYPEIAPPTVRVSATYTGANASVIQRTVIIPLEEQINGVEGMTYMTSTATNDGDATITVYFKLGTNSDINAVNVQNRVQRATNILPSAVTKAGVTVDKQQTSNLMFVALKSDNPAYDQKFLNNYANINLVPAIKRINGVGGANVYGTQDYAMRVWLKPAVMASYRLTPNDVINALAEQNFEAAPGKFGENNNQIFQYPIKYTGRLIDTTAFGNIVLRADSSGLILRLRDIAQVELGSLTYSSGITANGKPATLIAISQTAGSNAQQIVQQIIASLNNGAKSFPEGVTYLPLFNVNDFLSASIEKVVETLVEAYILVFLVVFLFLQDFRATLIPAVAVLVSIVGTFAAMSLLGFTENLLTLFALVLAIGIVVDDAIVVVEAVQAKLDAGYTSGYKASVDAMDELGGTIIAITLVMAAVFIPVSFVGGSSGVFFKQFGLTLASAILISAFNALTLSPALSALLLKPHDKEQAGKQTNFFQRFFAGFNAGFDNLKKKYTNSLRFLNEKKWMVPAAVGFFIILFVYFLKTTPSGFVPSEDQGAIFGDISLPPGSSLEATTAVATLVDSIAHTLPNVLNSGKVTGNSIINGTGSNFAFVLLNLKPWNERKGVTADDIMNQLFQKTAAFKDAKILFFVPPTVSGFGAAGGFSVELQDKAGGSVNDLADVMNSFTSKLSQRPEILYASSGFNPNYPQYELKINVPKTKQAGINVNDLMLVIQGYYGGIYASDFNEFGKPYRVMIQANARYRGTLQSLNGIYVRNGSNTMSPVSEFITLTPVTGPQSLSRFNLFSDVSIIGNPKEGYSTGDALNAIQDVAKTLPANYAIDYSGLSREENSAGSQTIFIYALCIAFVYFLLAALYESYIIPFAVLFALPIGLAGTYLFARVRGYDNNIYMQISVVMLIGLLAKNAILIVEYAVVRRQRGMSIKEAAIEAANERIRPILMTSLAFVFGLLPLMFSSGAGAAGNKAIGTGAVGGMFVGTILGIFAIPVLYISFQTLHEKISGTPEEKQQKKKENEAGGKPEETENAVSVNSKKG